MQTSSGTDHRVDAAVKSVRKTEDVLDSSPERCCAAAEANLSVMDCIAG